MRNLVLIWLLVSCQPTQPIVAIYQGKILLLEDLLRDPAFYDFLDTYLAERAMEEAALRQQLTPSPEALSEEKRRFLEERFGSEPERLQEWLTTRGLTEADLARFLRRRLLVRMLLYRHAVPDDGEIQKEWQENEDYWRKYFAELFFLKPEDVQLSMVKEHLRRLLTDQRKKDPTFAQQIRDMYYNQIAPITYGLRVRNHN